MKALSAAIQALCMFAHTGRTLLQAGYYNGAELYEQKSASTPRQACFFCIQTKGEFRALEQTPQKHSLFLK